MASMKQAFATAAAAVLLLSSVAVDAAAPLTWMQRFQQPALLQSQLSAIVTSVNNNSSNTWTAGENSRWLGRDTAFVKRHLGVAAGGPKLPQRTPHHITEAGAKIPTEFDPREKWPECPTIGEIRDQSNCGSCWAFGAVESASDRVCIGTGGKLKPHLSADDLLSCCGYSCGQGCDGGWPSAAFNYLATTGVVTGGNYHDYSWCVAYPFELCQHHDGNSNNKQQQSCSSSELQATPDCPTACDSSSSYSNNSYDSDKHVFEDGYSISSSEQQLQMELMTHGPVEVAFEVFPDFLTYKSGVYQNIDGQQSLGGHAVRMLGWGVEPAAAATTTAATTTTAAAGTPYWLIANSWNENWGDSGYFKILRGSDHCGIESGAVAGLFSDVKTQQARQQKQQQQQQLLEPQWSAIR